MKVLLISMILLLTACSSSKPKNNNSNEESLLHKEKILYVDVGTLWVSDFSNLPDSLKDFIRDIQKKKEYGTHDVSMFLSELIEDSSRETKIFPLPTYVDGKIEDSHINEAKFVYEKDVAKFGDCHTYPLASIRISFSKKVDGYLLSKDLTFLDTLDEEQNRKLENYKRYLVQKLKSGPLERESERKNYVDKYTRVAKDSDGRLYFMGAIPVMDYETSQIHVNEPNSEEFKLLKITSSMPCGS